MEISCPNEIERKQKRKSEKVTNLVLSKYPNEY